jgi:hypothetical protein
MKRILFAVLGASVLAAGCADPVAPAPPTPAAPTVTETFSDTLLVQGSNSHQFTVGQVGGVKVTLNSVAPSAAVGIGVGTPVPATGACTTISTLSAVGGPSVQMSGTATVTGSFCVAIYDVGNLVESVTYTITVLHS